jgi:hypothetical protein
MSQRMGVSVMCLMQHDFEYLDLDNDGVIDAVRTVDTLGGGVAADGSGRAVTRVEIFELGIGINGTPSDVKIVLSA